MPDSSITICDFSASEKTLEKYISGEIDEVSAARAEKLLATDDSLLGMFISACEASPLTAPDSLTVSVMSDIEVRSAALLREQLFCRRIGAAACFAGAAAAVACSIFGFGTHIINFMLSSQDFIAKLAENLTR